MLGYFLFFKTEKKKTLQNLYKKENFKPKLKPIIENFQYELCQLNTNNQKVLNFILTSDGN